MATPDGTQAINGSALALAGSSLRRLNVISQRGFEAKLGKVDEAIVDRRVEDSNLRLSRYAVEY